MASLLREGLAYCLVDHRPVFLDVARDRYFLLRAHHEREFLRQLAGEAPLDEAAARDVRRLLGIKMPLQPIGCASELMLSPAARLQPFDSGRANLHLTARAVFQQWQCERKVRRVSLARTFTALFLQERPSGSLEERQRRLIAAHRAAALVRTTRGRCLPASLALAQALAGTGYRPSIVIGVAMSPFRAHCWLQDSDRVLNDHPDVVSAFTPILIL